MKKDFPIVVLISGSGTNLQAILDAIADGDVPGEVVAVISSKANVYGLERAQNAGVPTHTVTKNDFPDRTDYDKQLIKIIDSYQPRLVVLAGYMKILGSDFVKHFEDRLINLHPSLLPKYPGLHTHERVLAAGDSEHGSTVHLVTEILDEGPAICQGQLTIAEDDTPETLQTRVQHLEHKIYPAAIGWIASGKLCIKQRTITFEGEPLQQPIIIKE